ncbi:MAG: hypothetical protein DIZ80_00145 [endosymbiont of Galathealinum brachiosum]|uniref:Uncharacterized protein n=1 Tax=endosymbiont of Galathealinum brachiosum TaxID=2200906 RepID=A0A370DLZ0_9GAMM|nr:MAG: hypothetical protein DIZ80_00145 [endosymbiont of Galathealinum brachiosum]
MFKRTHQLCLFLFILLSSVNSQANVSPVVLQTSFKIGAWQPLPENKIKSASVDSALSEISKTRRFAFFTSSQQGLKTGTLKISIKLVEAAETATVSILLQQVEGESVSSTHSESLKNKDFDGIYKQFQKAGEMAGKKIVKTLESHPQAVANIKVHPRDQARIRYLESQIININNKIIQQPENDSVRSEAKLEFILNELSSMRNAYADLAKKEDIQKQGVKIDKVLTEVGALSKKIDNKPSTQINVNQSYVIENPLLGQNKISGKAEPGRDDEKAQQLYNESQDFKRSKKYRKAEYNLLKAMRLSISSDLSSLILDELNYSLPMFEAQALAIDLGRDFQKYSRTGKDKIMLSQINTIYKKALKNNQHDFQRTREIQQKLDQHHTTSHAMNAVVSSQYKMHAHTIHMYMRQNQAMMGEYPDKQKFKELLKQAGLRYEVISYQVSADKYTARLNSGSGGGFSLKVDEYGQLEVN